MTRRTPPTIAIVTAALLVAAACATGPDEAQTAASGSSPSAAERLPGDAGQPNAAADAVEVTVSVTDGTVSPKPHRVSRSRRAGRPQSS